MFIVWRQQFLPSIAWKVSWALPSGVRNRDKMQNWAASHVAQNQSSDSHLLNWSTNLHQNLCLPIEKVKNKVCKKSLKQM